MLAGLGFVSPGYAADAAPAAGPISYYKQVWPLVQRHCQGCHQPARADDVRVYRTDDGERLASLTGHQGSIYAVAVHPDGTRVATGGFDGTVRLYDVKQQKLIKAFVPVEVETRKVAGKP